MKNPLILALTLLSINAFAQSPDTRRHPVHGHVATTHHPRTVHMTTAGTYTTTYTTPTMTACGGTTVAYRDGCGTRPYHRYTGKKKHCHHTTYHAPPGRCKKYCH